MEMKRFSRRVKEMTEFLYLGYMIAETMVMLSTQRIWRGSKGNKRKSVGIRGEKARKELGWENETF